MVPPPISQNFLKIPVMGQSPALDLLVENGFMRCTVACIILLYYLLFNFQYRPPEVNASFCITVGLVLHPFFLKRKLPEHPSRVITAFLCSNNKVSPFCTCRFQFLCDWIALKNKLTRKKPNCNISEGVGNRCSSGYEICCHCHYYVALLPTEIVCGWERM